ncbi:MAG TPA: glycoside hydrolase family 3 N-terminal domain-containing protein [Saprospiraceae bacterium]|nr:glycoside hydrolase family 3 N-terminal domain-containing protein [Saprospiraceae bacterium]
MIRILQLAVILLLLVNGMLVAQPMSEAEINRKIDALLAQMTLEEKVGQLTLFTSDWDVTGPTIRAGYKADIQSGRCGNIFNAHTAKYNRELQRIAVEETRLKIPLLFGYDVIHGYKTIFPIPLGETASWDLAAIETGARIAAIEATAAGLHWTFAPMVDIARDPRWGRIMEGAGEDHYLGSLAAAARVKGFQGDDIGAPNTMLACVKHFAAYGAGQAGRDYHTVDMSERMLREQYLPPYKAAIDAGAYTVMTSFNEYDGVPASGSVFLLRDILRNEWGFKGFVVTDYTSINEMVPHGVVANDKDAGELALNAGVDMDMQGAVFYNYLDELLKEKRIDIAQIDEAVRNVLRTKYLLGLFDDPYRYSDESRQEQLLLAPAHREAARDVARKSIVLLKNEKNTLPLSKNLKTVAVIGPLADNQSELKGAWSGAGEDQHSVSLLTGIRNKLSGSVRISHAKGCDFEGTDKSNFKAAIDLAKKSDAVVVAVGETAWMSGEAASRSSIRLPGVQSDLVKELVATGKPVIVVLMNGRPLAIPEVDAIAPAILETWFLGTETGNAIADVLFGDYNPSGKLPVTFPRNEGQIPIHYNMKNTGRPMNPDNKYTSKYLDVPNTPLYPFGYGLSYTTFEYSDIRVSKTVFTPREALNIRVTVTNSGPRDGEEVVQLYVRDLVGSVTRPVLELKGFQKIMLKAGESREVTFTLTANDLRFYDRQMNFTYEPGDFDIFVGTNSADTKSVRVKLVE